MVIVMLIMQFYLDEAAGHVHPSVHGAEAENVAASSVPPQGLEVGSIRRIQGLDTAYWGFLGVGTTLDIFQNIIFIPYFQYDVLSLSGYGVLSSRMRAFC
ncbi:hypothetical protein Tco_0196788 [Tanacetum coccineum]